MMYKKWRTSLIALGIGGMLLASSTVLAETSNSYLPENNDQLLPYRNDANEQVKFRGAENMVIKGGQTARIPTNLVRDEHGTLYYSDSNGITAVSPAGQTLWSYRLPSPKGLKYVTLGADGTIYAFETGDSFYKTKGALFAFQPDGSVKWVNELKDITVIDFSQFAGDSNGNFIVETEQGIASIAPTGSINWTNSEILRTSKTASGFIHTNITDILTDKQGNIIVNTLEEGTYILDANGKLKWKTAVNGKAFIGGSQVYILSGNGVQAFDTDTGKEQVIVPDQIPFDSQLPNDHEGGYYIRVENGIAKIDSSGKKLWTYELREAGYRSAYGLISDVDGNVYFTNNGGSVYSLNKDGQERFIVFIQNHVSSGSEITCDTAGNVYFLSQAMGLAQVTPKSRNIRIQLDGQEVYLPVHPLVKNGTTLLPMRKLFEMLGSSISWDPSTQTVTAHKGDKTITITVGSTTAQINGSPTSLEEAPIILDGSTLVPLRFVGEALGYTVNWDGNQKLIQLVGPNGKPDGEIVPAETKTILTDVKSRFFVVTGSNWKTVELVKEQFSAVNDQEHYLSSITFLKSDLKRNIKLSDVEKMVNYNLDHHLTDPFIGKSVEMNIGGLKAVQLEAKGEVNNLMIHYLVTVIEASDRFFILTQWSLESKFADALAPFQETIKSFRLMDQKQ